jgi:hypothetical protein
VAVKFATDKYEIFIDNGAGGGVAGDWNRTGGEHLVIDRWLPSGVSIPLAQVTLDQKRVRFTSRGLPTDLLNAELIPLVNRAGRRDIRVNRLGRVWVE